MLEAVTKMGEQFRELLEKGIGLDEDEEEKKITPMGLSPIWECCARPFCTLLTKLSVSASIKTFQYSQHGMYRYDIGMHSDSETTFVDHSGQFPQQVINSGHLHPSKLNHNTLHNTSPGS